MKSIYPYILIAFSPTITAITTYPILGLMSLIHSHAVAASGFCKQATSNPTLSLCRLVVILPKQYQFLSAMRLLLSSQTNQRTMLIQSNSFQISVHQAGPCPRGMTIRLCAQSGSCKCMRVQNCVAAVFIVKPHPPVIVDTITPPQPNNIDPNSVHTNASIHFCNRCLP